MENNVPIPEYETVHRPVFKKPPREYTAIECVFAWLCLFAGYLFCKAFPVRNNQLGGFLLILVLFISSTVILKLKV